MNAFWNWSFPLFRWRGVPIRAHITLPLVALFDVMRLLHFGVPWWLTPFLVGILFLSVLLHEGGHALATRAVGGRCHEIMLWALGGFARCDMPMRAGAHLLVGIMGMVVNLGLWALAVALLALSPALADHIVLGPCLSYLAYVNMLLLLINLIPCHPLDGSRSVTALLWGFVGIHRAVRWTVPVGYLACVVVFVLAVSQAQIFFALFAVWLGFTHFQEHTKLRQGADVVFDLDLAYAYGGKPGGWLAAFRRRRELADAERREREATEEVDLLDALLEKVSREGLPSLTTAERKQLERISKRQREHA